MHLSETFVAWSLGMTLISAHRTQLFEDLPHWLKRLRITHVGIVPSLIEATMHAVAGSDKASENDGSDQAMNVAYIASGGEKMSDAVCIRYVSHFNSY